MAFVLFAIVAIPDCELLNWARAKTHFQFSNSIRSWFPNRQIERKANANTKPCRRWRNVVREIKRNNQNVKSNFSIRKFNLNPKIAAKQERRLRRRTAGRHDCTALVIKLRHALLCVLHILPFSPHYRKLREKWSLIQPNLLNILFQCSFYSQSPNPKAQSQSHSYLPVAYSGIVSAANWMVRGCCPKLYFGFTCYLSSADIRIWFNWVNERTRV